MKLLYEISGKKVFFLQFEYSLHEIWRNLTFSSVFDYVFGGVEKDVEDKMQLSAIFEASIFFWLSSMKLFALVVVD